jgi:hypothetical protein
MLVRKYNGIRSQSGYYLFKTNYRPEEVTMDCSKISHMRVVAILLMLAPLFARGADPMMMINIMKCESNLRFNVWGDDGKSFGIAQFRKETFYEFANMAKGEMKAEKLWPAEWRHPQHQVFLLNWAIDHGYGNRWTCYRKINHTKEYSVKVNAQEFRKQGQTAEETKIPVQKELKNPIKSLAEVK